MTRTLYCLFVLGSFGSVAQLTKPDWINPIERAIAYPESTYFVGFSSQYFDAADDLNFLNERAKSLARSALAEYIHISIRSSSSNTLKNINGQGSEEYSKLVLTSASLETGGLQTETFIDKKNKVVYGLAFVQKSVLRESYIQQIKNRMASLEATVSRVERLTDKGRAYSGYLSILQELETIKGMNDMLYSLGLGGNLDFENQELHEYQALADERADQLRNANDIDITGAAYFLAEELSQELDDNSVEIILGVITYKNESIATEFSEYFRLSLMDALRRKNIRVSQSEDQSEFQYFLSGNYWPSSSKIRISAKIEQYARSEVVTVLSQGSVFISKSYLDDEGIPFEPPALKSAIETANKIHDGKTSDDGMHAELWTNKPGKALIFREGEVLKLSVRVNRPSYIRLINLWSDGTQLLLLDNYYVEPSKTNQVIHLPFEWETSCPCGVEYIQLIAQSSSFSNLITHQQDGFTIIDEPLSSVLTKSRGFGERKNIEGYHSEQTLTITTLKK